MNTVTGQLMTWLRGMAALGVASALINMVVAWVLIFSQAEAPAIVKGAGAPQIAASRPVAAENRTPAASPSSTLVEAVTAPPAGGVDFMQLADKYGPGLLYASLADQRIWFAKVAVCFVLISIGLTLFMIGAEGVFEMTGTVVDRPWLLLRSTSPGVVCFALAALIASTPTSFGLDDSGARAADAELKTAQAEMLQARAEEIRTGRVHTYAEEQRLLAEAARLQAEAQAIQRDGLSPSELPSPIAAP